MILFVNLKKSKFILFDSNENIIFVMSQGSKGNIKFSIHLKLLQVYSNRNSSLSFTGLREQFFFSILKIDLIRNTIFLISKGNEISISCEFSCIFYATCEKNSQNPRKYELVFIVDSGISHHLKSYKKKILTASAISIQSRADKSASFFDGILS